MAGLECEEETFPAQGGGRPHLWELRRIFVRAPRSFNKRAPLGSCGCRALRLLWEMAGSGLEPQQTKRVDPLRCYLQHRRNLLLGLTCKCSFTGLEDGVTLLPACDAAVKRVGKAKPWGVCAFSFTMV